MKNILLLGGYGFIGTNIIKYIDNSLSNKYSIIVFDKTKSHPHNIKFSSIKKTYSGNFKDKELLNRIFVENSIDIVIHLISATYPSNSQNPIFDIEENLIPTISLLQIMQVHDVKDIIFLSSGGAIYGNSTKEITHSEEDNNFPISSYGIIKLTIEKYLFQYGYLYNIRPLIIRLSNPYGPYHYSTKQGIINVALRKAIKNEKIQIWGNGSASKDYIYIEDFTKILFKLINKGTYNSIINVASGTILSVNEIMNNIKNLISSTTYSYSECIENDVQYVSLSIKKLIEEIGEVKFTDFQIGLYKTYQWLIDQN